MSGWGWFILIIILLVPAAYFGYIFYRRREANRQGLPPPPFNPFAHRDHGGSQIYPAPSGVVGWVKNKYYGLRNSRTKAGAYEQTSGSGGGAGGPRRDDDAWDSRVGGADDGYAGYGQPGSGGYYEEEELGLRPPPAGSSVPQYGHTSAGAGPGLGGVDYQRGRSLSRGEEDTSYHGGGRSRNRDNPFGDAAEASSMRAVSPRPDMGHQPKKSEGGTSLKVEDESPTERRSMFREENV